jgi:two-component system response regulator AtoC
LVHGETGTGKELVGALIHALSPRAAQPLVRFNCAAIPESLAEAELFGHVRGAFSGALSSRRGFFAMADRGTLVLDEIGELASGVQPKLLRVLQSGEIQPVGAGRSEKVDVRVVACTNRDLAQAVKSGGFRADLFYRLCVVRLDVPALRDRPSDIPLLAQEFVRRYVNRFGLDELRLSPALVSELSRRAWPGNVRELENTIARLVALSRGGVIDVDALETPEPAGLPESDAAEQSGEPLRQRVARFERELITEALSRAGGNQSAAARELGVSRVTLIDKLKRYGLL